MSELQIQVAKRALKIASQIMQAAGLCRYDSPLKCKKFTCSPEICDDCIEKWLIAKAKKELIE